MTRTEPSPRRDPRNAFPAPITWEARKGSRWQHRGCSTPRCTAVAHWLIAKSPDDVRAVRYACDPCRAKTYSAVPEGEY